MRLQLIAVSVALAFASTAFAQGTASNAPGAGGNAGKAEYRGDDGYDEKR